MTPQKYVPILIVWRFFGLAPVLQTILQNSTFRRFILRAILLKVFLQSFLKLSRNLHHIILHNDDSVIGN